MTGLGPTMTERYAKCYQNVGQKPRFTMFQLFTFRGPIKIEPNR